MDVAAFFALRAGCGPELRELSERSAAPTVAASTSAFRRFLRLHDAGAAFNVRRTQDALHVDLDEPLAAHLRSPARPSAELLAILDAAEWAADGRAKIDDFDFPFQPDPEATALFAVQHVLDSDASPVEEHPVLELPVVEQPVAYYDDQIVAKPCQQTRLRRTRSEDTSSIVPYTAARPLSPRQTEWLKAFKDACTAPPSHGRLRRFGFAGFQVLLSSDLQTVEHESSLVLLKPQSALDGCEPFDVWLESILTGADHVALLKQDRGTLSGARIVGVSAFKPDEANLRQNMYTAYNVLAFLTAHCKEGKSYKLFRDPQAHQIVLVEVTEVAEDDDDAPEGLASAGMMVPTNNGVKDAVIKECIRLAKRMEAAHSVEATEAARRLLLSARELASSEEVSPVLRQTINRHLLLSVVRSYRHQQAPIEVGLIVDVIDNKGELDEPRSAEEVAQRCILEIGLLALSFNAISSSRPPNCTTEDLAIGLSTLCAVELTHFCQIIVKQFETWAKAHAGKPDADRQTLNTSLRVISEFVLLYIRLGYIVDSALSKLPDFRSRFAKLRLGWCSGWEVLKAHWLEFVPFDKDGKLRSLSERLLGDMKYPVSRWAISAMTGVDGFRYVAIRTLWEAWMASGARLAGEEHPVQRLLATQDEQVVNGQQSFNECFGSSLLLMARLLNDEATSKLFVYDVKKRREFLLECTSLLLVSMQLLRLYVAANMVQGDAHNCDVGLKWLCVVCINLIRSIQLASYRFRLTQVENMKGAFQEAGVPQNAETTGCFTIRQHQVYLVAIEMATRLYRVSELLCTDPKSDSTCSGTAEPFFPLQTGMTIDQVAPTGASLQCVTQFTNYQLSQLVKERMPYMHMAAGVDMMQYSPVQKNLVTDTRWRKELPAPLCRSSVHVLDLPLTREAAQAAPTFKLVERLCAEVADTLLDKAFEFFTRFAQSEKPLPLHKDLFVPPSFSRESLLIAAAHARGDKAKEALSSLKAAEICEMPQKLPAHAERLVQCIAEQLEQLPTDKKLDDTFGLADAGSMAQQALKDPVKYQGLVPAIVWDLMEQYRGSAGGLFKRAACLDTRGVDAAVEDESESLLGSLHSIYTTGPSETDVPTLIQRHLKTAAETFTIDDRESAAAHYHLGRYLQVLADEMRKGSQTKLIAKLMAKRETAAVEHLTVARHAFDPSYCAKDFINVHVALFSIVQKTDPVAATACTLAADLFASAKKQENPHNNVCDDDKFLAGYVGVVRLRALAQQGLMEHLKALKRGARPRGGGGAAALAVQRPVQPQLYDVLAAHIRKALLALDEATSKALLLALLRKTAYHDLLNIFFEWD